MVWTAGTGDVGCVSAYGPCHEAGRNVLTGLRTGVPDLDDHDSRGPARRRTIGTWEVHISGGVALLLVALT